MIPVPNPVTVEPKGKADVVGVSVARKILLTVGRLDEQKDHATLIRAFRMIAAQVPDWDLKIVGEGALRPSLTDLIDDLGLANRVYLSGATNKIADEYLNAQLFVLPSQYESFGLTTAEALLHGLPAVGFEDCQGTNLLIRSGENGELVQSGDDRQQRASHLALTLARLMGDSALRQKYAVNASEGIKRDHDIGHVLDVWERIIEDAVFPVDMADEYVDQTIPAPKTKWFLTAGTVGKLVVFLASMVLLAWVWYDSETEKITERIADIQPVTIGLVVALLAINQLISTVRFTVLLRMPLNVKMFLNLNHVNSKSLVAGLLFFNVIGQGLSRSRFFYQEGVNVDGMALTGIERISSLGVLLLLASGGAVATFGHISFGQQATHLVAIGVGVCLASLVVGVSLYRSNMMKTLGISLDADLPHIYAMTMIISLIMHAVMAAAYLLLAYEVTGVLPSLQVVGAIFVVMLAASFPISFNGWGIRELSAGAAFAMLGFPSESGVAMSLMIGLLSIVALGGNFIVGAILQMQNAVEINWKNRECRLSNPIGMEVFILGVATCLYVFFFARVPYGETVVTANLADPIAILAGLSFVFHWSHAAQFQKMWRVKGMTAALLIIVAAGLVSFFIGVSRYGVTDWALINRFVGGALLTAYLMTGAGLVAFFHEKGMRLAGQTIVTVLIVISVMDVLVHLINIPVLIDYYTYLEENRLVSLRDLAGFAQNRNIFVFMLLVGVAFVTVMMADATKKQRLRYEVIAGLFAAAIYLTHSRSGIATGVVLFAVIGYYRWASIWRIATICLGFVLSIQIILPWSLSILKTMVGLKIFSGMTFFSPYSDRGLIRKNIEMQADRLQSYMGGLEMWLDNFFFGGGLGAFIHQQIEQTGVALVIHSTPLWLLAETGLVGFIAVLIAFVIVIRHLFKHPVRDWMPQDRGLFLLLIIMALMSIWHEMFYQRIFWLSLGIFAAGYWNFSDQNRAEPKAG
jgi:hypothetical protein